MPACALQTDQGERNKTLVTGNALRTFVFILVWYSYSLRPLQVHVIVYRFCFVVYHLRGTECQS